MISETYNIDCIEYCKSLPSDSVNIILTDPPYKYLKNQKLETDFNELELFCEWKRILKKGGFIVLFGRGASFYRWNYMLSELGMEFKEEIIWDKSHGSSPVNNLTRVHETISIFTFGKNILNKSIIPYIEQKTDILKIHQDLKRLISALNNVEELKDIENFLLNGKVNYLESKKRLGRGTVCQSKLNQRNRGLTTIKSITHGMREKSIIKEIREHYTSIHPTQKPVRLLERLLMLVKKSDNDLVLDCFTGSQSTRVACYNLGLNFIGCELDKDYFEQGNKRFEQYRSQGKLF